MRIAGLGLKLRMELASQIPGVVLEFHDFHKFVIRRCPADHKPCGNEPVTEIVPLVGTLSRFVTAS